MAEPSIWEDVFKVEDVRNLWGKAKSEGVENRREALFQRVIWRATYEKHIEILNESARKTNL